MIPGFYYIPNYLSDSEITALTEYCKSGELKSIGKSNFSRRVMQYGYTYAYDRSGVQPTEKIPDLLKEIINPIRINQLVIKEMEQLIINEYKPGQGIAHHTDHEKYFGPVIACITLGSGIEMEFINKSTNELTKVYVAVGSLYIMSGPARYKYTHGIVARTHDGLNKRGIRYSLTYRTISDKIKKDIYFNNLNQIINDHKIKMNLICKRYEKIFLFV